MPKIGAIVKLYVREAPVGVDGGALVAFPHDPTRAVEWLVTPEDEGFRLTAKGTEESIVATGTERAPVEVRADATAASVWRLQRVDDEGATTVASTDDLVDGTYTIDRNGLALGRDLFEDRSLLPKRIFIRTDDRDARWRLEVLV
ncbi:MULTISPECIES: hypothetical protein [unclassified Streptomyces]|uniref:hypothetical protein n=1 Tax=unclassified Streptomyces TaxID=2593676 RepID=UPI001660CCAB|nr:MULTISPECIES: hypothetical protein [unclassified Streptomyces]MBD0710834.1 hypothetical protein [Streptomyces sp. CBMA291]MBD0717752.1 hypothetical protein [Streptomyces sp. CBMA370]